MNTQKLKDIASSRGVSHKNMIEYLGIDESTFYRKMGRCNNTFSVEEAQKLSELLKLSNVEAKEIFLS